MGKFVGVSIVLFVVAVGFVGLAQGSEMAALIAAFDSEPLLYKIAWAVIVLVPLVMLPVAAWLWDRLARERAAARGLERRLDGARARVKDLGKSQVDAETGVQHLTKSDPEDAIAELQRRITEAERFAQIQQNRNAAVDLESRVDALRSQQQALKDRLGPVLDARRAIEQLFAELDSRQGDIDRGLAEAASGDDGTALDLRLKNLAEFVRQGNVRCDQIEHAAKTVAELREANGDLGARLTPLTATDDGIASRLRQVGEQHERLAANLDAIERTPEGLLAERVQKLAEDRNRLNAQIEHLNAQFTQLASLRKDVGTLFSAFGRALGTLSLTRGEAGASDADARLDELSRFVEQTQGHFDEIERRVPVFEQLRARLQDLQTRLVPLESGDSGVLKLIADLHDIREKLILKIRRIEGGEEGDLAARIKLFADAKSELEERVLNLSDQFARLSTIRKDIAGLFDKLSDAVSTSST